jgi:hypothetical protein
VFPFTLKRSGGYSALPYFNPYSADDKILTYKFLSNYSFIIEPSANMSMHTYSPPPTDDEKFTFKLCKIQISGLPPICQEGVFFRLADPLGDNSDSSSSSSTVNFDCTPLSSIFSLEIAQLSTETEKIIDKFYSKGFFSSHNPPFYLFFFEIFF